MKNKLINTLVFLLIGIFGYAQNAPEIAEIELIDFNTSINYGGGSGVTIHFNPKGVYEFNNVGGDNKFFLELSDDTGSFSNLTVLSEVDGFFTTMMNAVLPETASGNYRLRVRASKGLTGFNGDQPIYGEVISTETAEFNVSSTDYSQDPVVAYSSISPNSSNFNCTGENELINEAMFGSVTVSTGATTDELDNFSNKISITSPDSDLTYNIRRIDVFNTTITDLGTIGGGMHTIADDLPIGTYNYEIQATDADGISSLYTVILVFHRNATTLANSSSENICVGNEVFFNIDTSFDGIGDNFYGSYYTIDFGDGSPIEYYTHAELVLNDDQNQISHQFDIVSCGIQDGSANFTITKKLYNKFNNSSSDDCVYMENGDGVSKEVNTSLPPEAGLSSQDVCEDEDLVVFNATELGQYGTGPGGCLDGANFIWEIKKPNSETIVVFIQGGTVTQGPADWLSDIDNDDLLDLTIPADEVSPGCWGFKLTALNQDLCITESFFPGEDSFYTVNVQAEPQADFVISDENDQEVDEICFGQTLEFKDVSNISSENCQTASYSWTISPDTGFSYVEPFTEDSQSPQITFSEPGVYEVTQNISNLCGLDSKTKIITIQGDPTVEFENTPLVICESTGDLNLDGYTLDFNDPAISPTYSEPPFEPSTFTWTISGTDVTSGDYSFINGTGASDQYPIINFTAYGDYSITVEVDGECAGSNSAQFYFYYERSPEITNSDLLQNICSGESTQEVLFESDTPNTSYTFQITADDAIGGYDDTLNSGAGLPEMTLTNSSNSPAVITYTVTPLLEACDGSPVEFIFTVNPTPSIPDKSIEICSGEDFSLILNNSDDNTILPEDTRYTWTVGAVAEIDGESSESQPQSVISQQLTNTTNIQQEVVYTITPVSGDTGNCEGNPFTLSVFVNPAPLVNNQTHMVCSDSALGVDFNSSTSVSAASYDVIDLQLNGLTVSGGGAGVASGLEAADLADDSFNNRSESPVDIIYTVVPVSADGCEGQAFTVTASIDPEPVVENQLLTVCSDEEVGLILGNDPDGPDVTSYNLTDISFSNLNAGAGNVALEDGLSSAAIVNDSWENLTGNPEDVVYTFVPVGDNGCEGDPFTVIATIDPEPVGVDTNPSVASNLGFNFDPQENIDNGGNGVVSNFTWEVTATTGALSGASVGDTGVNEVSGTLTNTSNTAASVVYSVTPVSAASNCEGEIFTITVNINPAPVVNDQTVTVCSDSALGVDFNSSTSISTASYNVIDLQINGLTVSGGGAGVASGLEAADLADDSFTNKSDSPVDVIYTVVPVSSEGVEGQAFTVTATIDPEPVVENQLVRVCSDEELGLTLGNDTDSPGVDTYNLTDISFSNLNAGAGNVVLQDGLSSDAIANDSWENLTGNPEDVVYTFVPVANNGCEGDPFTVRVTIDPKLAVNDKTVTVCNDSALGINFNANTSSTGVTYNVTNLELNGLSVSGGGAGVMDGLSNSDLSDDRFINSSNSPIDVVYTVLPISDVSCDGNSFTVTATINPTANLNSIQDQTICSQFEFEDIILNSPTQSFSNIQYTWEVISAGPNLSGYTESSGLTSLSLPISGEVINNASNTTEVLEYTVTPYFDTCPGIPQTFTITVLPTPKISDVNQIICTGETFNLNPDNNGGGSGTDIIPDNTTYTWNVSANPNVQGQSSESAPQPNISQTLVNLTNTAQDVVYTITPTSSEGCEGIPFELTVTVETQPVVANKTVEACSGETFIVEPTDSTPVEIVPENTLYTWNVIAGSSDLIDLTGYSDQTTGVPEITQTLINLSNEPKTIVYEVIPASGTCVGSAFEVAATISPQAFIEDLSLAPICSEDTFSVTPQSGVPSSGTRVPQGTNYTWTVENNPNITGESDQPVPQNQISQTLINTSSEIQRLIYTVTPDSGGCEADPFSLTVEVTPRPFIESGPAVEDTQCSESPFTISPQDGFPSASTIVPEGTQYTWVVSSPNPDLTGWSDQTSAVDVISQTLINTTSQIQQITYTVTPEANGCVGETFEAVITIEPKPFVSDVTANICNNGSFVLNPQDGIEPSSEAIIPNITNYSWSAPVITGGIVGGRSGADEPFFDTGELNNPTNTIQTAVFTVTPSYFSTSNPSTPQCAGDPFTITVEVAPTPQINEVITNVACSYSETECAASIEIDPEGIGPFTYNWISLDGNPITNASDEDQYELCPGDYSLQITDALGCTSTFNYEIEPPQPIGFDMVSLVELSCNNTLPNCDGYIEVDISGGTTPYDLIEWYTENTPGSGVFDQLIETENNFITNVCEGNYVLKVLDANGCEFVSPVYTIEEAVDPISISDTISDYNGFQVSCSGSNDGFIEVLIDGGSGNFTYALMPGDIEDADLSTPNLLEFNNLVAGEYTLVINDSNCPSDVVMNYTLEAPAALTSNSSMVSGPAQCFGGTVTYNVSASGGVPPYTGTGNYTLNAGEQHQIIITDANGCETTELITIPEPPQLMVSASIVNPVSCFGGTAEVEITALGGASPYSGTGTFDVSAGEFTYTVSDANGCNFTNSLMISEPEELSYTVTSVNNPTCSPDWSYTNGSICIEITGGTNPSPIGDDWVDNGNGKWCLDNLIAGDYSVNITDENDCDNSIGTTDITLTRPPEIDAFITSDIEADCASNTVTQTNNVIVSGGTPPYQISWSAGEDCDPLNSQCMVTTQSGVYTAFIHDQESLSNGCPPIEVEVVVDLPVLGGAFFDFSSLNSDLCGLLSVNETISFTSPSSDDIVNVYWDFGDGSPEIENDFNPTHSFNEIGTYQVELIVEYEYGCTESYTEVLEITKGYKIILPNAFTPNTDGMNDTIRPVLLCVEDVKMSIYDTWGALLYTESGTDDTLVGWDGTFGGDTAENGNYVMVVEAVTFSGKPINLNAPITLIK